MAQVLIDETNLTGIADAIREKNKTTTTYSPSGMADAIKKLVNGSDSVPVGVMVPYGSETPPDKWLLCDGREVSRTEYSDLFAIIGTNYGVGDGETTFNLPNKKGKVSVGLDSSDNDFNAIGKTGGEKAHTLTVGEIPSHNHALTDNAYNYTSGGHASASAIVLSTIDATSPNIKTGDTGGSQSHNNLQPYEVDNWIIKAIPEDNIKNAITVGRTEEQYVTTNYGDVYFTDIRCQQGGKLTLSNGNIRIGAGIKRIRVSGAVWAEVHDGYTWGNICLNANSIGACMVPSRMNGQDVWRTLTFPTVIVDVNEGDIIRMSVTFNVANANNRFAAFYTSSCYMTVEEL